jgi:hypothetical protein
MPIDRSGMSLIVRCVATAGLFASTRAFAFESDVHYGLTQWLAMQAGFGTEAAQIIATGDQRVDSGDMQFIELVLIYACIGKDELGQRLARDQHYPSAGPATGPPEQRMVQPGSAPALKAATELLKTPLDKSPYMLLLLGGALHTLQDSWSHQGTPDVPRPGDGISCDPNRAWAHPATRGGWNSHKADLTMYWPADTVAMAKSTYDIFARYPMPPGAKQKPKAWNEIGAELDAFARASTKTDKKNWFVAHGITDVSFLEGISLPDGKEPFTQRWPGRKLPPLPSAQSRQHDVNADVLAFFSRFFTQWMSSDDFAALATTFGPVTPKRGRKPVPDAELIARLKVWRLRDHGRVADIAHLLKPLSAIQRRQIDAAAKPSDALARYTSPGDAFFPLLPRGKDISPLLPFYVSADNSIAGKPRAVAVTKLRHAPYDSIAVVAEQVDGQWRVVAITSTTDH